MELFFNIYFLFSRILSLLLLLLLEQTEFMNVSLDRHHHHHHHGSLDLVIDYVLIKNNEKFME